MSDVAGLVRSPENLRSALSQVRQELEGLEANPPAADPSSRRSLDRVFLIRDIVTSQYLYLSAMADYLARGGRSRGSVLYTDPDGDLPRLPEDDHPLPSGALPPLFRFRTDDGALDGQIQETWWDGNPAHAPTHRWRPVRPIPVSGDIFETVWRAFSERGGVAGRA
jgi:hypothetical protein